MVQNFDIFGTTGGTGDTSLLAHNWFLHRFLFHHMGQFFCLITRVTVLGNITDVASARSRDRRDKRDITVASTRLALEVAYFALATLLLLVMLRTCRNRALLLGPFEQIVVVDGVYSWLALDFNIKGPHVVLLDTDGVRVAIDSDKGAQRVLQSCIIPVILDLIN